MDKSGVIYILTNPSFPEYVKIEYADDIDKRLQQLNRSECIPFAFRVYTYESISSAKYVMVALALALQKCRLFFQR